MMSGRYEYDLMATRRKDPDYEQVSGYVHKDLALRFRIICTTERLTQSELLEEALKILIELKDQGHSPPPTNNHTEDSSAEDPPSKSKAPPATKQSKKEEATAP